MSFSVNYPVAKQVMREINFTRRVSVRYNAEACVARLLACNKCCMHCDLLRLKAYVNVDRSSLFIFAL